MERPHYNLLKETGTASGNLLLEALPHEEYKQIAPHLECIKLAPGKVLYNVGEVVRYAYFPKGGMLSLLAITEAGRMVEVGMIGNEGIVGIPAALRNGVAPFQVMVQIQAHAFRISGAALREVFRRGGHLQDLLMRYVNTLLIQITQSAACNRYHSAEERFCRWLLNCHDRAQTDTILLTQEFLSHMLGVPRSSVTAVASALQNKRLIRYSRGKITIMDRQQLEAAACECYDLVRKEFRQFLVARSL